MKKMLFIFSLSLLSVSGYMQKDTQMKKCQDIQLLPICKQCREVTLLNGGVILADSIGFDNENRAVIIYTSDLVSGNFRINGNKIFSILPTNKDSKLIINTIN